MDFEKLMKKKVSRKTFLKSLGLILLMMLFFPKSALTFMKEDTNKKDINKEDSFKNNVVINGVKVMEVVDE